MAFCKGAILLELRILSWAKRKKYWQLAIINTQCSSSGAGWHFSLLQN
jgi:hypothetical protein